MSFVNAATSKHHLNQLQAGREAIASKDKPPTNPGGLNDFLDELNQATNLRMQVQEEMASETRLKSKKTQEVKGSKVDPELQILQKQDQSHQNPANIADSGTLSDPVMAKIMAALEQLNQQNQAKTASLLSNWGGSEFRKTGLGQQGFGVEGVQNNNLDLEALRTNLKNLGFENILGNLEKAQASGNLEQIAGMQAQLAEKLLAQIANLNTQNSEVKAAQALQRQLLTQGQMNTQLLGSDSMRLIAVEPSLAQELKMKQAADLDTEFTLLHNALLGSKAIESVSADESTVALENIDTLVSDKNLLAKPLLDGQSLFKTDQPLDESIGDDFSANLLSASQIAQGGSSVSTPTQIAMSLNEASIVSGPLHSEIMSAAKAGGGRIQLELTPPEQGTIRIDLRIDQSGRAHLIVEGANDAAKARLDQGGQQLKNEFAQMGLNLSLDLRQGDSRFAQNQQFGSDQPRFAQPSSTTDGSSRGIGLLSERFATTGFLSDSARDVSGIHLYA
jgi:hypothetical protein